MYRRFLNRPNRSIFLLGPRGTGKSTWLRDQFRDAAFYDLLDTGEALRLAADPGVLFRETAMLEAGSWVVIDEVQKAPALLDEVHRLIEERGLNFVLSGSSARKLKRGGVNLLAGRATMREMFPLVSAELGGDFDLERSLRYGTMPMAVPSGAEAAASPENYLRTYAQTYLVQEVQAEALTRNIGAFARFMEVAARHNAQLTNATNIARDVGVSRRTVENHFEVLTDTLLGTWLPAWKLKASTRQVQQSKFHFFDCGVARALSGRLPYPPLPEELGFQAETFLLTELRAFLAYSSLGYTPHFWRDYSGSEVDFVCETATGFVAIEVKVSRRWEKRFNRGLRKFAGLFGEARLTCYGIYLGDRPALWDDIHILPFGDFLRRLWAGEIIQ